MKIIKPPKIFQYISKNVIFNYNSQDTIYLTFDDCSDIDLTLDVIDLLEKYKIKASFFPIGEYLEYTQLHKEIQKHSHVIGNHTYSHLNGLKTSVEEYYSDAMRFNRIVETIFFRPPYGKMTPKQASLIQKHFKVIMWSVMSYDFDRKISPQQCFDIVKRKTKPGSIIVFHTNEKARKNILYALPATIDFFLKKSYKFDVVK